VSRWIGDACAKHVCRHRPSQGPPRRSVDRIGRAPRPRPDSTPAGLHNLYPDFCSPVPAVTSVGPFPSRRVPIHSVHDRERATVHSSRAARSRSCLGNGASPARRE
jgi:hypothetical protein